MGNTGMVMGSWISSPPEDQAMRNALNEFVQDLSKVYSAELAKSGILQRAVVLCAPYDAVIFVTTSDVFVAVSKGSATAAVSTHYCGDFTAQPDVDGVAILRDAQSQLGWSDIYTLKFDRRLLTDKDARSTVFHSIVKEKVAVLRRTIEVAKGLGIQEAATFIQNARIRFDTMTPVGYNDCKTNCRSALLSLLTKLSGENEVRAGIRKLAHDGLLGDREKEVVEAVEEVVGTLAGLASKKGAHPPLTDENNALFTLRLTEAVFDYLVTTVARQKGV
jgi:hypothetical protein